MSTKPAYSDWNADRLRNFDARYCLVSKEVKSRACDPVIDRYFGKDAVWMLLRQAFGQIGKISIDSGLSQPREVRQALAVIENP